MQIAELNAECNPGVYFALHDIFVISISNYWLGWGSFSRSSGFLPSEEYVKLGLILGDFEDVASIPPHR